MNNTNTKESMLHDGKRSFLLPFILVTTCFALWGFANDVTNPMVKAFSKIFRMSVTDGALVQLAFYGGYFVMAFPAALFIRKYSYKAGIMLGLGLYAIGALLFLPAREMGVFFPFLIAYFILTCGLSFLETSCNPYILTLGSPQTATRRLNMAQSFNPIGSLCGMFVAMNFIQNRLNPLSTEERKLLNDADFAALRDSDLAVLIAPYLTIGIVILVMLAIFWMAKLPQGEEQVPESLKDSADDDSQYGVMATIKRICSITRYREGVVAQFFYVGVQIMSWTFIIQYGTRVLMQAGDYTAFERFIGGLLGLDTTGVMIERNAEVLSQGYNILAMLGFCTSRFICTFLMRFVSPGWLLRLMAILGAIFMTGVICLDGRAGIYCLVAVSFCMSLMFPTIYGIALDGIGRDAKFAAAGLIMAILGGSVLPPLQAAVIDLETAETAVNGLVFGIPAVNLSFVLPLICFIVVMIYGHRNISSK